MKEEGQGDSRVGKREALNAKLGLEKPVNQFWLYRNPASLYTGGAFVSSRCRIGLIFTAVSSPPKANLAPSSPEVFVVRKTELRNPRIRLAQVSSTVCPGSLLKL